MAVRLSGTVNAWVRPGSRIARGLAETRAWAVVVLAAVAVAGCSEVVVALPEAEATRVSQFLDSYHVALREKRQTLSERSWQVEDLIARCMADAGFEYVPVRDTSFSFTTAGIELPGWMSAGSREFREAYGYGLTTDPWGSAAAYQAHLDGLVGYGDPNEAYRGGLTPEGLDAYLLALEGAALWGAAPNEENPSEDDGSSQVGCRGRAEREVADADATVDWAALETFMDEVLLAREAASTDPRRQETQIAWSACMATAGYPDLDTQFDASTLVRTMISEWRAEPQNAALDGEPVRQQEAMRAALGAQEIAVAVADWDCAESSGHADALDAAIREGDEGFEAVHGDELEAWLGLLQPNP